MIEDKRPDPEQLLSAVQRSEARLASGRLRVFFGMSAGVGKTYAMLKAAQDAKGKGIDIVIGLVETHGRSDTAALMDGLPLVPRRRIEYRGTIFEELDLDAILKRHPHVVLVDELAHSNVPGSRHDKRWQDVLEILDAGIDVYTTLNVQHLESRKEPVEAITSIPVSETVPDTVLERATNIVLIDIAPTELLQRLREGKVYLGERAQIALEHFFKEDRLTALRELALRFTAERVDNELQDLRFEGEDQSRWRPTERLMVAISHSPSSEYLIRSTRRLAYSLDAPWIAVHVNAGQALGTTDRATLSRNVALVRDLGGELITTDDVDIAGALERIATQRQVTQLIIGRPTQRFVRDRLTGGTLLDRLARRGGGFDVHVLRPEEGRRSTPLRVRHDRLAADWRGYLGAFATVAVVSLLSAGLKPLLEYRSIGFLFLFATLVFALFARIGPILVVAALSALVWNFFFIPPTGTFAIRDSADLAMCGAYFVIAATTGVLTQRIRQRERLLRQQEHRTHILYDVARIIAQVRERAEYLPFVSELVGNAIDCDCAIAIVSSGEGGIERWYPAFDWLDDDVEMAVAIWAMQNRTSAGWSTDTLPGAKAMYAPLTGKEGVIGIIACRSHTGARLLAEEQSLLATVSHQIGVALEREVLQERAALAARLNDSEKLHQTLLNSVSHEMRTPLTAILGAASALQQEADAAGADGQAELVHQIADNAERLNRVVGNLLDLSRLESGVLTLRRDWHDPSDLISLAVESTREALANHQLRVISPGGLPLVRLDISLFEHVLTNLLLNAAMHTPAGTSIEIGARAESNAMVFWISDEGPGIPPNLLPHVFDKFARSSTGRPGGLGIGLSIAKGIVEAHGGTILAANNSGKGSRFTIRLPLDRQPSYPDEENA
jgi:two-component system sensor histidine kinase KdpD